MADAEALRQRARQHVEAQQWRAAADAYGQILQLDADDVNALSGRGLSRVNTGEAAGAVEDLTRAIALQPDHINARFNRGLALHKLGRFADALADFEAYLAADPADEGALRQRARCRADLGQVEENNGRLAAPPSTLDKVPAHLRVEEAFGWGWPTFGGGLAAGGIYCIAHVLGLARSVQGSTYAVFTAMIALGVAAVAWFVRKVQKRLVLVPTERGLAIYRQGRLYSEATRNQMTYYAHSVFNTLYLVGITGFCLFMAVSFGGKEPGILVSLLPVVAMLVSNLRSRLRFTHVFVLRGEGTAMFPTNPFARAFGDSQRWA